MRMRFRSLAAAVVAAALATAAGGQVVISQVDGAGGLTTSGLPDPYDRDFVELFNRGTVPVDLTGWSLQLWGDTGSSTTQATPSWDVIPLSGIIYPGQYFLVAPSFQRGSLGSSVTTPPLPAPDVMGPVYDGAILVTSINAVALMSTTSQIPAGQCPSGPDLVDLFRYAHPNGLCFEGSAAAPPNVAGFHQAVHRNNGGCTDTNDNAADLTINQDPTPRNSDTNVFLTTSLSSPNLVEGIGGTVRLTVTRGPSPCNPLPGPLTSAVADLSAFGLSASHPLFDDGIFPDLVAGDGVFTGEFNVPASQPAGAYAFLVGGTSGPTALSTTARIRVFPPPAANDFCANAINLTDPSGVNIVTGGPHTTLVNTTQASPDADAGTCNGDAEVKFSVWYAFTAPANGALRVTETSTEDVVFSLFTSCGAASSSCVNREDGAFPVAAGNTYFIQVGRETGAFDTPQVPLELTFTWVPIVANDTPCAAASIASFPFTDSPMAPAAADELLDVSCNAAANPVARHGVWYTFQAPANGVLEVFENSINSSNISLFTGPDCNSLFEVDCADETLSGALVEGVVAGNTYWVLFSIDSATTVPNQPYDFTINFLPAPVNDLCDGAIDVTNILPFSHQPLVRAAGADLSFGTGSGSNPNPCSATSASRNGGVWYRYQAGPTVGGTLRVRDDSSNDVHYNVFTGSCGGLSVEQCYGQFTNDDIFIQLQPSTEYFILVTLSSTSATAVPSGPYDLHFELYPFPDNDLPCNATVVAGPTFVETVNAPGATADVDLSCNFNIPVQTSTAYGVWYHFPAGPARELRVNETASDDLVFGLFTGPDCNNLTEIECRMGGQIPQDFAAFNLQANTGYWLLVGKISGSSNPFGVYEVAIDLLDPSGACCSGQSCTITTQATCPPGSVFRGPFTYCGDDPNYEDLAFAPIPDGTSGTGGTPGLLERTITVPDAGVVNDLKVLIDITHARVGDLIITLTGPGGHFQDLIRRIDDTDGGCPSYGQQGRLTDLGGVYIFDDQSVNPYGPTMPPAAKYFDFTGLVVLPGHYRPTTCNDLEVSLNAAFQGTSITGTWTLTITDNQSSSTGALNRWGLIINGGATPPCACRADFNNSGAVTVQDIFDFLSAYFSNSPSADINGVGGVTVQDIFDFLALYFAGC